MSARRRPETKLLSAKAGTVDRALLDRTGFRSNPRYCPLPCCVLRKLGPRHYGQYHSQNDRIAGSDELTGSFLDIMNRSGLHSHIARQEIVARFPDEEQAKLLDILFATAVRDASERGRGRLCHQLLDRFQSSPKPPDDRRHLRHRRWGHASSRRPDSVADRVNDHPVNCLKGGSVRRRRSGASLRPISRPHRQAQGPRGRRRPRARWSRPFRWSR